MRGKTHAAAGACCGAMLALLSGLNPPVCVGAAVCGALAPDVDSFRSPAARQVRKIRRGLAGAAVLVFAAGAKPDAVLKQLGLSGVAHALAQGGAGSGASAHSAQVLFGSSELSGAAFDLQQLVALVLFLILLIAGSLCKHRGPTHSLAMLFALSATLAFFNPVCAVAFAVGYASHLALDMLNYQKVPLLWPLQPHGGVAFGLGKSGGQLDSLLLIVLTIVTALLFGVLTLGHSGA